jgi:hypothetical protein
MVDDTSSGDKTLGSPTPHEQLVVVTDTIQILLL